MSESEVFESTIGGSMPSDPDKAVGSKTILEELREELGRTIERPEVEVPIPSRPNVALRFRPDITQAQLKTWRNNSGANSKKGLDSVRFACYVIGDTLTGIYINGERVENENGDALLFTSTEVQEMTNASSPFEAIEDMFVVQPHLESAAFSLLEAAGYGDEVEAEDPSSRT